MSDIIIVGAGSLGRVMYDFLADSCLFTKTEINGFVDQNPKLINTKVNGLPVYSLESVPRAPRFKFFPAILDPQGRKNIIENLLGKGVTFGSCMRPSVFISPSAKLGEGTTVLDHSFIMSKAEIGDYTHLHFNSIIGHDVKIGKYSSCAPGVIIGGYAEIADCVMLGMGARVLPGIKIGQNSIIGAGAIVTKDIPANCIAFGNPAKPQ